MSNANNKKKFVIPSGDANQQRDAKISNALLSAEKVKSIRESARNLPDSFILSTSSGIITSTLVKPKPPGQTTQQTRATTVSKDPINAVCPDLDRFNKMVENVGTSNATDSKVFERRRKELQAACNKRANSPKRPSRTRVVPEDGDGKYLIDNVLNDYVDVQYHITLSMLSEEAAVGVQNNIPKNIYNKEVKETLTQELKRQGAIVLASTGDVNRQAVDDIDRSTISRKPVATSAEQLQNSTNKALEIAAAQNAPFGVGPNIFEITDEVATGNSIRSIIAREIGYYNIKSMTLENAMAPSANDPFVSTMLTISMTFVEPNGFKLVDDLRNLRCALGWENINSHNVLYRVDVRWSGYNPSTGEWVHSIPINARKKNRKNTLTFYCTIQNMEAEVTATGAEYKIAFIPSGAGAFSGTDFSMDAAAVFTGKQNTFGQFTENLATVLNNRKKQNTAEGVKGSSGIERQFEFIMPSQLREAAFYSDKFASDQGYLNENKDQGGRIQIGRNTDLITVLRAALTDTPYVQEQFINNTGTGTNNDFSKPRTHYTFRFNTVYSKEKIPNVHEYKYVKIQIIIEPFLSFRKGSVTPDTLAEYVSPASQKRRIEEMQNQGMIIRKYDYLNTSENTEVIDFGLNFSSFYLESLKRNQDWGAGKGIGNSNTTADLETRNNTINNSANLKDQRDRNPNGQQAGVSQIARENQTAIQRLFGNRTGATSPTLMNDLCNPNQVFGGGFGVTIDQDSFGATASDGDENARKDQYTREMLDYVSNDFLQIDDLRVRGDPVWLLSPYSNEIIDLVVLDTPEEGNIITPTGDKVIFLDIRRANQNDAMNPNRKTATSADPSYIGGFYTVLKVISVFEGGLFTQTISGAKMNHLNFAESQVRLEDFNNEETSRVEATNQDIAEAAQENLDRKILGKDTLTEPSVFSKLNEAKARTKDISFRSKAEIRNLLNRENNKFGS